VSANHFLMRQCQHKGGGRKLVSRQALRRMRWTKHGIGGRPKWMEDSRLLCVLCFSGILTRCLDEAWESAKEK
jgi:hypothetical protein